MVSTSLLSWDPAKFTDRAILGIVSWPSVVCDLTLSVKFNFFQWLKTMSFRNQVDLAIQYSLLPDPIPTLHTPTPTNFPKPDRLDNQHPAPDTMPGLLDLPPELIEQVHFEHEQMVSLEHEDGIGVAEELGHFRLTSRYIERATRRAFVQKYFAVWHFKASDDASIEKICAMASTLDLAAAIKVLKFYVDDDYNHAGAGNRFPKTLGH